VLGVVAGTAQWHQVVDLVGSAEVDDDWHDVVHLGGSAATDAARWLCCQHDPAQTPPPTAVAERLLPRWLADAAPASPWTWY
jgi:hypothetical protein